jgi:spermidine/putrescine-binding protein
MEEYGINIEYDRTLVYPMSSKLITSKRGGGKPPVDINWTVPALGLKESFLEIHEPLNVDLVPNLNKIVDKAKYDTSYTPNNEPWPVAPLYFYTITLTYREDMFNVDNKFDEPFSWKDLWDESLKDSIGVYHEGWGTTPIFGKVWGNDFPNDILEASIEPWKKLKPNLALIGDDPEHVNALAEGEAAIVITIPTNALEAQSKGAPIGITVPKEGTLGKRDVLGVAKDISENKKYWAMKYVNKALDPQVQTKLCETLGTVPIVEGAKAADKYLENPAFPTSKEQLDKIFTVPAKALVENQGRWFDKVAQIIG